MSDAYYQGLERERQLAQERDQAQYDAVVNGLAAATSDAEAATAVYQQALERQDFAGAAEAQRRIATARTGHSGS
jgi:hypothetical protein